MTVHGSHRPGRPAADARATCAAPARLAAPAGPAARFRVARVRAARVRPARPAGLGATPGPGRLGTAPSPPGTPGTGGLGTARRRVGLLLAAVAGLLVAALVVAVLAVRPGVQAGAPRAVGQQPATRAAADPSAELPRLLTRRAEAVLDGDRAAFLATVDKRQTKFYKRQASTPAPGCAAATTPIR